MPKLKRRKKSNYKFTVIKNQTYYFYKITWADITGDAGQATVEEFDKFKPSIMITQAYVDKKDRKNRWTFASYEGGDELFSDRNVYPSGCILKMEKINEK